MAVTVAGAGTLQAWAAALAGTPTKLGGVGSVTVIVCVQDAVPPAVMAVQVRVITRQLTGPETVTSLKVGVTGPQAVIAVAKPPDVAGLAGLNRLQVTLAAAGQVIVGGETFEIGRAHV